MAITKRFASEEYVDQKITEFEASFPEKGGNVDLTGYATEEFVENAIIENALYKPIPIESIEPNSTGALVYYNINIENLDKDIGYYFNPKEVADYPNARIHIGRVRLLCDDGSYASITNISPSTKTIYLEKSYDTKWNWIFDNVEITIDFTDRSTSSKVVKTRNTNKYYLLIGGNAEYIPNTDYSPATKKYVDDLIAELEDTKVDNPSTGAVGQILEIESVGEDGKPKTYKAVDKPTGGGNVTYDAVIRINTDSEEEELISGSYESIRSKIQKSEWVNVLIYGYDDWNVYPAQVKKIMWDDETYMIVIQYDIPEVGFTRKRSFIFQHTV